MIRRVHHTSFTVSNMDRSLAFYRDLLGMNVVNEQGGKLDYLAEMTDIPGVDLRIVFLRPTENSEHLLELIEYRSGAGAPADVRSCNPGAGHLCFVVEDLFSEYERLRAAGVRFRSPPVRIAAGPRAGGYAVYMLDPDGVTLELLQMPPGS